MNIKAVFVIFHLLGVILGAGGAFLSDLMFLRSVKDSKITKTELGFLKLGGNLVSIGLIVLIISGVLIFATNPLFYVASSKFMAKMTIVLIITINGVVLHKVHMKRMERHVDHHFPSSDEFCRNRWKMMVSGAVSIVSWISALILGSLKAVPYSYFVIIFTYLGILSIAIAGSLIVLEYILPGHHAPKKRS